MSAEQVLSDKEALFVFENLAPQIDGFVFLPDADILSPESIRGIMRLAEQHNVSILAYNPLIINLGADVGIDNIDDAIARQAVQLVMLIREKAGKQVPLPMRLASRELNVSHVRHAVPAATSANSLAAALVQ